MAVILEDLGVFYASVPKVACTSIKRFFFEIENGFEFRRFSINGRVMNVHHLYKALPKKDYPEKRIEKLHRVAVVREPVARFLSAYSNRVRYHQELSRANAGKKLTQLGLEPDPEIGLFVDRLEEYQQAQTSIMHHTRPMIDFLGDDPRYFDRIYRMSELGDFEADINEMAGTSVTMPHSQSGGPKIKPDVLSADQLEKIKALYVDDYAAYGVYF